LRCSPHPAPETGTPSSEQDTQRASSCCALVRHKRKAGSTVGLTAVPVASGPRRMRSD
jgi:hypothetical protein